MKRIVCARCKTEFIRIHDDVFKIEDDSNAQMGNHNEDNNSVADPTEASLWENKRQDAYILNISIPIFPRNTGKAEKF